MNHIVEVTARRILVIDDNETVHKEFREILGRGYPLGHPPEVVVSRFGEEAKLPSQHFLINAAFQAEEALGFVREAQEQQHPYALAFVAVGTPPGWDGIGTAAKILQRDPDIQIVICTGCSDDSWRHNLTTPGHSDRFVILKKPFDATEVLQLTYALTEKWRLTRQSRATLEDVEQRVAERTHELVQLNERLQASGAQYRLLFDSNPHPMWVYDLETLRFVAVNEAAIEHYGYSQAQFLAMTIRDIRPPEDIAAVEETVRGLQGRGKNFGTWRHRKQDGSLIDVEISADNIVFNDRPARLILAHDVTVRNRAEVRNNRLNRVYAVLSQINALIVRAHSRDELFADACRILVEDGGFRMAVLGVLNRGEVNVIALAGQSVEDEDAAQGIITAAGDMPTTMAAQAIQEKKAAVSNNAQHDARIAYGEKLTEFGVHALAVLPLIVSDEAVGVLALYANERDFFHDDEMQLLTELTSDISFAMDHIDKQERLDYLAYYDALTGLANRSLFLERLAQSMRSAAGNEHQLAVILIDLERFKNINDSLGRTAGDALLRLVAEWLTSHFGDARLLARVDSDHFAVVVPTVRNEGEVARLLENAIKAFLAHPFRLDDTLLRIAAKFGVALFPDDGDTAEVLFEHAEAALKKAKASGDRSLFHTQKMTESVASRLRLETQLRQALDNEEFVLHYQPKVHLLSGKVTSAEALIRWNDPRTGLVPPNDFIPLLEETGLIHDVGRWALEKAIDDYLRWRTLGLAAVPIAVNVSPLQLRNRGFVAEIERKIGTDPRAAAGLELEITESMIMEDINHAIASLRAIRAMGITIAIDDFGTGFSSLGYLAKLPIDTLKIDSSFVADVTASPEGLALMATMINLAHSLKLKAVAEGVETEEQSRLLRLLKCDEIQGYWFSRPVSRETFESQFLVINA